MHGAGQSISHEIIIVIYTGAKTCSNTITITKYKIWSVNDEDN